MPDTEFTMFGAEHAIAVAASLAGGVAVVWAARRFPAVAPVVLWGLALACLGSELFLGVYWWREGLGWRDLLPLHLCDTALLLAPFVLLTRNRVGYEVLFLLGVPGALVALITPALYHGFPSVVCLCFFGAHALILTSAAYATAVLKLRPTPVSIVRAWAAGTAFVVLVALLNPLLGTNYMFLSEKPFTASLLDVLGPWPWYIVAADGVALVAMCLCYLPFWIADLRARRLDRQEPVG